MSFKLLSPLFVALICLVGICSPAVVGSSSVAFDAVNIVNIDTEYGKFVEKTSLSTLDLQLSGFNDSSFSLQKLVNNSYLLAGVDVGAKPAPYGAFNFPNQPYGPNSNQPAQSNNNPIYSGNVSSGNSSQYENILRMDNLPYSPSVIVIEGLKGNSHVVRSQVETNIDRIIQDKIRRNVDR